MADSKKMNAVEQAIKVTSFRKVIREECRKKGLEYPSDDKIAEWIEQDYGWNLDDFMADYTTKNGIFREPIVDFINEINKINWGERKPTEEDIRNYASKNGYDTDGFRKQWVIRCMKPLVRKTLLATIAKLTDAMLVNLWNIFIEESAMYGADSYIYDLTNAKDIDFLEENMTSDELKEVLFQKKCHNARYIQWFTSDGGQICVKTDIKGIIISYWEDIYSRIMAYPFAYAFVESDERKTYYFDDVFFPILREKLGYQYDERKNELVCTKE